MLYGDMYSTEAEAGALYEYRLQEISRGEQYAWLKPKNPEGIAPELLEKAAKLWERNRKCGSCEFKLKSHELGFCSKCEAQFRTAGHWCETHGPTVRENQCYSCELEAELIGSCDKAAKAA